MDGETSVLVSLYDALDRNPSSVEIQERLLEVWKELGTKVTRFCIILYQPFMSSGWQDLVGMAFEMASVLKQPDPNKRAARRHLQERPESLPEVVPTFQYPVSGKSETMQEDLASSQKSLEQGYTSLKLQAKLLREEIEAVRALGGISSDDEVILNLQAISDGRVSKAISMAQMLSARKIARNIMVTPNRCQELIVEDFETLVCWATSQTPPIGPDAVRERLVKR